MFAGLVVENCQEMSVISDVVEAEIIPRSAGATVPAKPRNALKPSKSAAANFMVNRATLNLHFYRVQFDFQNPGATARNSVLLFPEKSYLARMALVRILVDGYSLLHGWPELAEGSPRHSEAARDALVEMLTQYQDACGTPVTIFFDGRGARRTKPKKHFGQIRGSFIFQRGPDGG